jgi:hypothetical protein
VLSVFFDLRILVNALVYVCHCVFCLLRFTDSCYLFDICWPLCCLSSLIYIFWLFLLYLLAIVFGICWPLCCLSSSIYIFWLFLLYLLAIVLSVFFDLRFLVISLVYVGHFVVCLLRFTDSGYLFGICWPLCCLSSSIYRFWLSLWYLLAIVLCVFFDLQILVISLVSVGHCVVCLLRFTYSGYLFCIFLPLCCLSSSIYGFWLSLLYLLAIGLSVFFDLRILVISLKSVGHCVVSLL